MLLLYWFVMIINEQSIENWGYMLFDVLTALKGYHDVMIERCHGRWHYIELMGTTWYHYRLVPEYQCQQY